MRVIGTIDIDLTCGRPRDIERHAGSRGSPAGAEAKDALLELVERSACR